MLRLSGLGLSCIRGSRSIFDSVNLELSSGEALVLVGPNGSGKSSLLRLIAGLLPPAAGRIELAGGVAENTLAEQAHYLGHLDALKLSLTVAENLGFWVRYLGGDSGAVPRALASIGLGGLADLPAAYLSAGQRRRLSLARLIAVPRPLWLLDEPTSALDAAGQERLAELMRQHLGNGGLIVAATHGPLGIEARELRLGEVA
jgi:heme exporter protein A